MFKFMRKKYIKQLEANAWYNELDEDTQRETAIKYLRQLDKQSFKKVYEAAELYRQADSILRDKVKDPEPVVEDDPTKEQVLLDEN